MVQVSSRNTDLQNTVRLFAEEAGQRQRLANELRQSSIIREQLDRAVVHASALSSLAPTAREIARSVGTWESLVPTFQAAQSISTVVARSGLLYEEILSKITVRLDAVGLMQDAPDLSARLLHPYEQSMITGAETARLLQRARSDRRRNALTAGLTLTSLQTDDAVTQILPLLGPMEQAPSDLRPPRTNAPRIIRAELLSVDVLPEVGDIVAIRECSPTAQLTEQSRSICRLITDCNRERELRHQDSIFIPTTTFLEALNELPFLAVVDKSSLGDFIDYLYFLLYEGAGQDHLRYLNWGLVTDAECRVIWSIKSFRNVLTRHDPDHGKPGDIRRKRTNLLETLEWIGLSHLPRSRDDFMLIQSTLLSRVYAFLQLILTRATGV